MAFTEDPWLWLAESDVPYGRPAIQIEAGFYDGGDFEPLDNVVCLSVTQSLGTDPGHCRLRYRFTTPPLEGAPSTFEEALGSQFTSPKTIEPADRILVRALRPGDNAWVPIFDGFALSFELGMQANLEQVTILCVGVAMMAWSAPIGGAIMRQGDDPSIISDVRTSLFAHFNPRGLWNKIHGLYPDDGKWAGRVIAGRDGRYPTFLDADNPKPKPNDPEAWHLHSAIRYVCFTENADELWVRNPDGKDIDGTLVSREPIDGKAFNVDDPTTFVSLPLTVADQPITGKQWPLVVHQLISDKGFEMTWDLGVNDANPFEAITELVLFDPRLGTPKDVMLQPRGSTLDPALSNLSAANVGRDLSSVVNEWDVQGELIEYEVSFVLKCGFPSVPGDAASASSLAAYSLSNPAMDPKAYRVWALNEIGQDAHYENGSNYPITTAPNLDALFGPPDADGPTYAVRHRRPIGQLISKDELGEPRRARLAISIDYPDAAGAPNLWTGYGTWQPVSSAGWELLPNRIGIRLTCQNPNDWHIGTSSVSGHPFKTGIVKAVQCIAAPDRNNPAFYLRLTCVVRGDRRVHGLAQRKLNSVVPTSIRRVVEAHDRYRKQVLATHSEFNTDGGGVVPFIVRDDSDAALAESTAFQMITQNGVLGGSIFIPRFTRFYRLGETIGSIQGRDLSFRTDSDGTEASPTYPVVTKLTHNFEPTQHTVLEVSDVHRGRHRYTSRGGPERAQAAARGGVNHRGT